MGLTVESARRYGAISKANGLNALKKISLGGRKSALDDDARKWLTKAIRQSPRRHGFDADRWSCPKVRDLIERNFGVRFSTVYVRQIAIDLGVHDRMRQFSHPMRRPPAILDSEALAWIATALSQSPRLLGFDAEYWTNARLRTAIERKVGVRYSVRYVWQIATELGLSHVFSKLRK